MDGYGKRVLVAEDDDVARDMLSAILVQAGYMVHAVRDGQEALAELKRRHFDVVVTDYHMPRLNGMELLSLSRVVSPDTAVIMISGDQAELSHLMDQRGMYAWIPKPYDTWFLLEVIRDAAHASSGERAHSVTSHIGG
jgi:CheY-like chemotaxis protein